MDNDRTPDADAPDDALLGLADPAGDQAGTHEPEEGAEAPLANADLQNQARQLNAEAEELRGL
jgi:hypothetical protein